MAITRLSSEERQQRIDEALSEINDAVANITTSDEWRNYLDWQAKFHRYSAGNCFWLMSQAEKRNTELDLVAGYRTWQSMGRQVRKGEIGFKVLAPLTYRHEKTELEKENDRTYVGWQKGTDGSADPDKDTEIRIRGMKIEHVFDVSQTDGPPETLPHNPLAVKPITGECPAKVRQALEEEIMARGYTIEVVSADTLNNALGNTQANIHLVRIRDDLSPAASAKTLTHELAHIALEHARSDPQSECEAESTAYIVMKHLGIDTEEYSFGYIAGWTEGNTQVIQRSTKTIQLGSKELIDRLNARITPVTADPLTSPSLHRDRQVSLGTPAPQRLAL